MIKLDEQVQAILDEQSMAWVSRRARRCCWVENPIGYANKYFKYYNSASSLKATKLARISIIKPEYITGHSNPRGVEQWVLNTKEKSELSQLMLMPSDAFVGFTHWHEVIITYNRDNFGITPFELINGTVNLNRFKGALRLDTQMPDYMLL